MDTRDARWVVKIWKNANYYVTAGGEMQICNRFSVKKKLLANSKSVLPYQKFTFWVDSGAHA